MKNIYSIFTVFFLIGLMVSCQNEEDLANSNVGYLRLQMGVNASVSARAGEEIYNPKQIAVQIISEEGEVVEETTNWETEWEGKTIALAVGNYTLQASSAGFDGKTSGFDKPYYAGSAEFTIESNKEANVEVTCTLANVKVTVNFDQSFVDNFTAAQVVVDDNANNAGIAPLTFVMNETTKSGYFPVTDLQAVVSATNKFDVTNTQTDVIENVKARDHYILNYKVGELGEGSGNIGITVDPTTKTYTYTFYIPTTPSTQLGAPTANAWAKLAYLTGSVISTEDELTPAEMSFQYRVKDAATWTTVAATQSGENYQATLTSLQPNTTYESRMVYGEEEFVSDVTEFTTEAATALYNGNFDNWNTSGKTVYPNESGTSFWDTSNPGTTTGLGAIVNINPTTGVTDPVHTSGGQAAKLETRWAVMKLAAASIYTGKFNALVGTNGAKIDFGQPFTSRPISLKGWYQYKPELIDNDRQEVGNSGVLKNGDIDLCSIYIILSKGTHQVNNTETGTLLTLENVWNNEQFIAYGELPADQCVDTNGEWKEFNIPLQYKEDKLSEQPTHLIIVSSSSKYGDYFTGAVGSVLYLDDFELVYDGTPAIWER